MRYERPKGLIDMLRVNPEKTSATFDKSVEPMEIIIVDETGADVRFRLMTTVLNNLNMYGFFLPINEDGSPVDQDGKGYRVLRMDPDDESAFYSVDDPYELFDVCELMTAQLAELFGVRGRKSPSEAPQF